MAGSQVTIKTNEVEKQRLGYIALSLTNWDNFDEPEITAGSKIEIGGSLYEFTADEDIDPDADWAGFSVSTQIYGYLIISGASVTSKLTTTPPVWDDSKQGWYDATNTYRYFCKMYKSSGGSHNYKSILTSRTCNNNIHAIYPRCLIADQKASGVAGGTFTIGAWRTRDLNTVEYTTMGVEVSANRITLPPGYYRVQWSAPACGVYRHNTRLYAITLGSVLSYGTSEYDGGRSIGDGTFAFAATTVLEIQHRCELTAANTGFGAASGSSFAVGIERYTVVAIEFLAEINY